MTLQAASSFQFGSLGWSLGSFGRTAGTGQNGYASLRATVGAFSAVSYGYAAETEVIHGWCLKWTGSDDRFFSLYDAANEVVRLYLGPAGEIIVQDNGLIERGRSGSGVYAANVETYFEVRVKHSVSVGEVEVRINGAPTPVVSVTGIDTGTQSTAVQLYAGGSGTRDLSAWYFVTVDATAPNDFLGHIRFGPLQPSANGANSDLVGNDGNSVDNYLLVDDPPLNHDSDTTYVQSSTVGDKDTYAMSDLPTTPLSVVAVLTNIIAKKTDAGTRGITPVIRSGGTDYLGATEHFLGTSYTTFKQVFVQNPDGPADWDETSINAMEVGVEVTT